MKKFRKPRCPYCGDKISLANAWALRTRGEYLCPKCGGISNVVIDRLLYLFAFLAILTGAVFFTLGFVKLVPLDIWLILLVILPFLLFYLMSVFLVRLKKPSVRKRQHDGAPMPRRPSGADRTGNSRN